MVKDLPASAGDRVQFLGRKDSLEEEMTKRTPEFLPGKSRGERSLAGLESTGSQRGDQTALSNSTAATWVSSVQE